MPKRSSATRTIQCSPVIALLIRFWITPVPPTIWWMMKMRPELKHSIYVIFIWAEVVRCERTGVKKSLFQCSMNTMSPTISRNCIVQYHKTVNVTMVIWRRNDLSMNRQQPVRQPPWKHRAAMTAALALDKVDLDCGCTPRTTTIGTRWMARISITMCQVDECFICRCWTQVVSSYLLSQTKRVHWHRWH